MPTRRTTAVVAVVATLLVLTGCGTQGAPEAGRAGRNSTQVPGTRPSPPPPSSAPVTPGTMPSQESSPASSTDPSDGVVTESSSPTFAIVDQTTGDYVIGQGRSAVLLEIGIHGVGKAWTVGRMQVRHTPHGTTVRYDGRGDVDPKARLGPGYSLAGRAPVDPHPAHLRLDLVMTADGLGHADVWIDGRHHRVVANEPPHTAQPVVTAVVAAFRAEDWSAMYDLTVRLPGMSRADFIRAFGKDGSVSELEITGDTVYRVAGGVGYADTPAHVVATIRHRRLDRDVVVRLVYRENGWRFSTIATGTPGA